MKKAKVPMPLVQECLAAEICREKGAGCDTCLTLPEHDWKAHVRAVLARPA